MKTSNWSLLELNKPAVLPRLIPSAHADASALRTSPGAFTLIVFVDFVVHPSVSESQYGLRVGAEAFHLVYE
jgi:hypothetical protein